MISRTQSGNATAIAIFLIFGLVGRVLADDHGCDLNGKSAYGVGQTKAATETGFGGVGRVLD